MKKCPKLLSTAAEISELAAALRTRDIIAFDTEFIREQTFYPIVEIIQVATDEESWLVDARAFKKGYPHGPEGSYDPGIEPLLEVFRDPKILKIVHAAQGDEECLYTSFKTVATPIVDTAVAASLCGYGESVGLGKLLKSVLGVVIKKGHARTNWSIRPLPEQLTEYAHADVEHLVELGRELLARLDRMGRRQWAVELSAKWADPELFEADIEGMADKLGRGSHLDAKANAALFELLKWREERVRQLNLPRRWVADDAVLVDLARVRPKDMEHLSAFRGLNKGELKHSGERILRALKAAAEAGGRPARQERREESASTEESQASDLLKCFLGILADRHHIAARHLATAQQLLPLVRNKIETPDDLVKVGALSEYAARLIGEELVAFVQGRRALSVVDGKVLIVKVGD